MINKFSHSVLMSRYGNSFKENNYMSLLIKDDELLENIMKLGTKSAILWENHLIAKRCTKKIWKLEESLMVTKSIQIPMTKNTKRRFSLSLLVWTEKDQIHHQRHINFFWWWLTCHWFWPWIIFWSNSE